MNLLRTLKKMILGETWLLPVGIALTIGACVLVRALVRDSVWQDIGGFALLTGVAVTLASGVAFGARRR